MNNLQYIRFDQREDVLASIELIYLLAPSLRKKPTQWKWVIIASQSAVQGAMVCALSGTAGIGALKKELQAEWLDWFENRQAPQPKEELAPFKTLLKWARNPKILSDPPLILTSAQVSDLTFLHDKLRNNFSHFTPKGWSIEAAGLSRIIIAAIDTAERLMLDQFQVRMHLNGNQIRRIKSSSEKIRKTLLRL